MCRNKQTVRHIPLKPYFHERKLKTKVGLKNINSSYVGDKKKIPRLYVNVLSTNYPTLFLLMLSLKYICTSVTGNT